MDTGQNHIQIKMLPKRFFDYLFIFFTFEYYVYLKNEQCAKKSITVVVDRRLCSCRLKC